MENRELRDQVRRTARGDELAGAAIFDEYYPRIYRFALARLRDHSAAEDIASETFARVLRSLDDFKWRGGGFEAWLFRIAGHLVVDHARAGRWVRTVEDVTIEGIDTATPEAAFVATETAGELSVLMEQLPPDQREVLRLRFMEGLDPGEIARVIGRKANAVRQLQFRALSNLRGRLATTGLAT